MRGIAVGAVATALQLLSSCSTLPKKSTTDPNSVVEVSSSIQKGDTIRNFRPLPDVTPGTIRQEYSDGHHEDRIGYMEYDFNGDGAPDMLGVLDRTGEPSMWVYDFDFDGKVDAYERVTDGQKKSHRPK